MTPPDITMSVCKVGEALARYLPFNLHAHLAKCQAHSSTKGVISGNVQPKNQMNI